MSSISAARSALARGGAGSAARSGLLTRLVSPRRAPDGALELRAARFVMGWALAAAVVMATYAAATVFAQTLHITAQDAAIRGPVGVVGLLLSGLVYALARHGLHRLAAQLAIILCLAWVVSCGLLFYRLNPQPEFVSLWMVTLGVPVLTAALLVSWQETAVVAAMCVGLAVSAYVLVPEHPRALWGASEVVFALSACALVLAVRREKDLESLREVEREREAFHAKLVATDRLASLGMVAAGVVHEVNNPLTTLQLLVAELEGAPEGGGEGALWNERLGDLKAAVTHIAGIARDLSRLSRMQHVAGEPAEASTPVDPREPLSTAIRMVRPRVERRAELEVELRDVPLVQASATAIAQICINLIMNAAQATPRDDPRRRIRVRTFTDPRGFAVLEVEDEGEGLDPAQAEDLFTPFVTTKPPGEGTGLGLYITRKLVRDAGGEVVVDGAPGQGACFRIKLPPATAPTQAITAED